MNILIADDHAMFRDTLHLYIHRAHPHHTVHMAANLAEVIDFLDVKLVKPDLIVLDFKMPGMRGISTFENMLRKYPDHKIAVMSGVADIQDIEKILDLGIAGYLPKTLPGRMILGAIDKMLAGEKYVPLDDGGAIMPSHISNTEDVYSSTVAPELMIKFTAREKDVLNLLCEGKSNKDIAQDLGLQTVTVKLHIRGIFKKLDCDNRTQAALKAKKWGLIS